MKRLLSVVLIIVLCVTITACSQEKQKDYSSEDASQQSHQAPPYAVRCESLEQMLELRGLLDQSDDVVEEYLTQNQSRLFGLSSKRDVEKMFEELENINTLYMVDNDEYTLVNFSYYISYGYIYMCYTNGNDRVQLLSYLMDSHLISGFEAAIPPNEVRMTIGVDGHEMSLRETDETCIDDLIGYFHTNNSVVVLICSYADESATINPLLQNYLKITTFSELLDKS